MTLGNKLKNLRKQNDLTQEDLAKLLGTANSTISMYERDARVPDFETMRNLAEIFRVDMNYLVGHSPSSEPPKLTEGEEMILDLFRRVPEDQQKLVLQMIRAALGNQE